MVVEKYDKWEKTSNSPTFEKFVSEMSSINDTTIIQYIKDMQKKETQKLWFQHNYLKKYYSNEAQEDRATAINKTKKLWNSREGPWKLNGLDEYRIPNYIKELSDNDCDAWVDEVMSYTELKRLYK